MRFSSITFYIAFPLLILTFQNCSGGFQTQSGSGRDASNYENSEPADNQPSVVADRVIQHSVSEMEPISIALPGIGDPEFHEAFPQGSSYHPLTKTLNWIPKRGQAGEHEISVTLDNQKTIFKFNVTPVNQQSLQVQGPPFKYSDGDVGYIFVHGMGTLDRCANPNELAAYWGLAPGIVAPDASTRTVACYDSRKAVKDVAASVAQQILNANCGRMNKCIVVAHSMGGLLMEHMFLHTREARTTDPEPGMYANRALYTQAKSRVLFVIGIASAAGGSKTANLVESEGLSLGQEVVGFIGRLFGQGDDCTKNLVVEYASRVVAPLNEDPEVPFFMIPGYTAQTMTEATGYVGKFFDFFFDIPLSVFNGNREYLMIDGVSSFHSRSDGVVDLRSGCGIASDNEDDGPGTQASLAESLSYCYGAAKKPNHYVWFMSNLNHDLIKDYVNGCDNTEAPCVTRFPNPQAGTFSIDSSYTGKSAVEVIRMRLGNPAQQVARGLAQASQK